MVLEDSPEYIVDCNELYADMEDKFVILHHFICDKYRLGFPKLEFLIHHPMDYAHVVKKIGNEMDLTIVDMNILLP
uniref:U4/U6 small nuclear ribonucleoprotein Prp31 isoform X1 n=1 Tax=Rhizophora mucronata TaxID=61149 RepID=A0A2P2QSM7_RHIMU